MGAEVGKLVAAEEVAVFEGLVRRDIPGEATRVRVEIDAEKVSWPRGCVRLVGVVVGGTRRYIGQAKEVCAMSRACLCGGSR